MDYNPSTIHNWGGKDFKMERKKYLEDKKKAEKKRKKLLAQLNKKKRVQEKKELKRNRIKYIAGDDEALDFKFEDFHFVENPERFKELSTKKMIQDRFLKDKIALKDDEKFTEEEAKELRELKENSFLELRLSDFNLFVRLSAKYGRHSVDDIFDEFSEKNDKVSKEKFNRFVKTFWLKIDQLPNGLNKLKTIEKGEYEIKEREELEKFEETYLSEITDYKEIDIPDALYEGKAFKKEQDRLKVGGFTKPQDQFLLFTGHKHKLKFKKMIKAIEKSKDFGDDMMFVLKNEKELTARYELLLNYIGKLKKALSKRAYSKEAIPYDFDSKRLLREAKKPGSMDEEDPNPRSSSKKLNARESTKDMEGKTYKQMGLGNYLKRPKTRSSKKFDNLKRVVKDHSHSDFEKNKKRTKPNETPINNKD